MGWFSRGTNISFFLRFQFNNILNDQYLACSSSFGVLMIVRAIWNFPKNVSMVRPKSGLISQRYYYYRLPHRSKHCYLPPTTRILGRVQQFYSEKNTFVHPAKYTCTHADKPSCHYVCLARYVSRMYTWQGGFQSDVRVDTC